MIRLDGNAILIADPDLAYGMQLSDSLSFHGAKCFIAEHLSEAKVLLKKYDFDLVISNYYLTDGIIHQLIDWSSRELKSMPIYTCIGYPYSDRKLSEKHSIADLFTKSDSRRIVSSLSKLLFDQQQFKENILELLTPREIMIELHMGGVSQFIRPLEIHHQGLYLQNVEPFEIGAFGILKFSLLSAGQTEHFLIPGHFEEREHFKVSSNYLPNWEKFVAYMDLKQLNVTNFLHKAAGL